MPVAAALIALVLQSAGLEERIGRAVADSGLKGARVGVAVIGPDGSTVASAGADAPLKLASNTKLFTTSCALDLLGPDFAFKTVVGLEGATLHVFGGGDPTISGRFHDGDPAAVFRLWALKLKELKVGPIEAIVLHDGLFDRVRLHPDWIEARYDQDEWWCAPVGALSLNDNCVDLVYEPGEKEGDPARISVRPDTAHVTIVNRSRTVKSKPKPFGFVRKKGTNEITVNGELQLGSKPQTTWMTIHDPAAFFGAVLKETLERGGLETGDVTMSDTLLKDHPDLKVVATFESDLARAVRVCNTVSQNFYAEMILRTLGVRFGGEGSAEAGTRVVRSWLAGPPGITGVTLADGSGLSPKNTASAGSVASLLEWWKGRKHFDLWRDSLAAAGEEPGTLRRRMTGLKGRVRGKSGTLSGVSCLSGYAEAEDGSVRVFSVLVNGWKDGSPQRLQDRICELLVKHGAKE